MTDIKISASLPQGDANGLGPAIAGLVSQPHRMQVLVAIIDCQKITTDQDTGAVVPTARFRRVEVIQARDDMAAAGQLMRRAMEARAGRSVLPLDLEDELRAAFGGIDPRTGERIEQPGDGPQ